MEAVVSTAVVFVTMGTVDLPGPTTPNSTGVYYYTEPVDYGEYSMNGTDWPNVTTGGPSSTYQCLQHIPPYPVVKSVACVVSVLIAFFGNALVIYAYATTKNLRTYTNHYIASMAVADLVSGGITPIFAGIIWVLGCWPFDATFCTIYQYINHIFLQATFLLTLAICYDRFRALRMPLKHLQEKTRRHAYFLISLSYFVPVLIWTPLIVIFPFVGITHQAMPPYCHGSYGPVRFLLLFAILVLSWIPMIATIILYIFVYSAVIRKGVSKKRGIGEDHSTDYKLDKPSRHQDGETKNDQRSKKYAPSSDTGLDRPEGDPTQNGAGIYSISAGVSPPAQTNEAYERTDDDEENTANDQAERPTAPNDDTKSSVHQGKPRSVSIKNASKRSRMENRLASVRATRTLTYILITTVVSALPWSVVALWAAVYPVNFPVTDSEFKLFGWISHLSSSLNPFCYAACSPNFREAFLRVLRCRKDVPQSRNPTTRQRHSQQSSTANAK